MEQTLLYQNNNEYTYLLTFDRENIFSLLELELNDFGSFLDFEQWKALLLDQVIVLNSVRDKQSIYLLQLACADIISPIRKDFMKIYLNIEGKK